MQPVCIIQVAHCNAPPAQVPFYQSKIMVRAQLVSFDLYQRILAEINGRYNVHDALVLKLFFILAYRTGMRKSEILGLRFSDFENIETQNLSCIVRPHSARSIKTTSSKRRILLSVCLKADELKLLKDYLAFNIPSTNLNQIVFTSYVDDQMLGSHVPSQALSAILDDIYGQDVKHGISVHSFRHTAINNFALYFNGHADLIDAFTDFSSADVKKLRVAYTGSNHIGQQGWFLIARIAGHLHPHMTFLHYIHLSTLIAGYQLSQSETLINAKILENIAGISKQNLYDEGIHKTNTIKINKLNRLITRREFANMRKHEDISLKIEKTKQRLQSTNKKTQQTLFDKYNFSNIKFALMYLQRHRSHSCHDASEQYNMSTEDIHQLYKKARTVAKQTTNKGMSRFYRKEVLESLETHEEPLFPRDITAQDRKLLQPFFSHIDAGFSENKEKIKQFLDVAMEKITTKRTWLNFSAKPKKLNKFLGMLDASFMIIPADYILIYVPSLDIKAQLEKYLNGRKVDIVVRDVNYIQLGVKHINYNTDHHQKTQNRHFSSVLRYIVQVLMIVMMD